MKCPRCKSALENIDLGEYGGEYAAVVIDSCPECGGVWYDKGELDARDESVWTDVEAFDFETRLSGGRHALCPRCEVSLIPVSPRNARDIVVDRCPDCFGFWLDAGELESIQNLASQRDSEILGKMTTIPQPDEAKGPWLGAFLFLSHRP
jgi:Zn-finger nucleic acid-binding protein